MRIHLDAVVIEFPCGTAPASMAGYMEQRHALFIDMDETVLEIAKARYEEALAGDIRVIEKMNEDPQVVNMAHG
ncbi:hypothetical protein CYMTET_28081 [Cymbomonas tetramitiformis]|uniref:Uncharacterized protein n=1 Tax=Cymbomonas tetramitiformis TaxID=36881 RepID=A0AAE0FNV5_9CHLO|nr:hypothetical protein CYMTET_28081 [Cymbomonas tetramitiformis]